MHLEPVVGLSGQFGSGKSSLAAILAERTSWKRAAFGDYLRHIATERGSGTDRASLQQLGEEQIALGWEAFCVSVLDHFDWKPGVGLIVDGLRHVDAITTLNRLLYPQTVFHIHLAADHALRLKRITSRDGGQAVGRDYEFHSTEADVTNVLPKAAHLVLDAARSVEQLADNVLTAVSSARCLSRLHPLA